MHPIQRPFRTLSVAIFFLTLITSAQAGTSTWDGKHDTSKIVVKAVYFVPSDRRPLRDWRDRVEYYCRRIEQFHAREFQGQSELKVSISAEPLISKLTTPQLRQGDADAIFFRTLQEAETATRFAEAKTAAFPILLVFSDINWRPLDDFYRLKPQDGRLIFEGNESEGQHFPGAASGGSRATMQSDRGIGWGLVSADGWRVPCRGSDCVVYHEGCGHTVGLPHPEPADSTVMSLAQYTGWISESSINKEQKIRLGWEPQKEQETDQSKLFSAFRAVPDPVIPKPDEPVRLKLDWPEIAVAQSLRVRYQTALDGPWTEAPQHWDGDHPEFASLGRFDCDTPISYRVDATLKNGATAELWGYLQVMQDPAIRPQPLSLSADLIVADDPDSRPLMESRDLTDREVDLLQALDPTTAWAQGTWQKENGTLVSPKEYGARIELPYTPTGDYRVTLIVEPLDEPHALVLGHRKADRRFLTLFSFAQEHRLLSAIENIDGRNVGNETTFTGALFRKDRLSQVIVTVRAKGVTMSVDGQTIVRWQGATEQLSMSDYWTTPNERALFIGTYQCRYRMHRITVESLSEQAARNGQTP
jgi:hypothetical protein